MYQIHNDEPVSSCMLKREEWRQLIVELIANTKPPKAIAIHGTWGTGKTSMLKQLKDELERDNNVLLKDKLIKTVWFEAWQYQHEPNILVALLKEIRDQIAPLYKLWDTAKGTVVPAALSALQSFEVGIEKFGLKFGFKDYGKNFVNNEKEYLKERLAQPVESATTKDMLREGIDQLLKLDWLVGNKTNKTPANRKAVIFIDDLDRCEPDVTYRILETIKIYLNLENCVFVLGMDLEAVERSLAKYYEKQLGSKDDKKSNPNDPGTELKNLARVYHEKIVQDVFHLPVPSPAMRVEYLQTLLTPAGQKEKTLIPDIVAMARDCAFLPPFPRSIKMLANVMLNHLGKKEVADYLKQDDANKNRLRLFTILCYLYAYHFEVFNLLYLYPEFYNSAFLPYAKDPNQFELDKGKHPVLSSLQLPERGGALSESLSGATREELKTLQMQRTYPHENLRQVLWIRKLVVDTGSIEQEWLEKLKF